MLARRAFARELFRNLELLASAYRDWQDGHVDGLELDDFILAYLEGPCGRAHARYATLDSESAVARALARRLLEKVEVPPNLRSKLEPPSGALSGAAEDEEDLLPPQGSRTTDEELSALREQRARWIASINEGSVPGFVAILTDDAVWLPSRHEPIRGRREIGAWLERPFATLDYDYSVSDVRIRVAGGWAIEQARFSRGARQKTSGEGPAAPPGPTHPALEEGLVGPVVDRAVHRSLRGFRGRDKPRRLTEPPLLTTARLPTRS